MRKSLRIALVLVLVITLLPAPKAQADLFSDVWGVITDPFKLGQASSEASDAVDRIIVALELLQTNFDSDVRDYLVQINEMIGAVDQAAEDRVSQIEQIVLQLEAEIFKDAHKLLVETECSVECLLGRTLPETVYAMLLQLEEADISVKLPFVKDAELTVEAVRPLSPDITYIRIRNAYLGYIKGLNESDSAYQIIIGYQNISELAFRTYCHFARSGGGQNFLEEHAKYASLLRPWVNTSRVRIQE